MGDYVIKQGDTLSAIAKRYGTTVKHLQNLNHIQKAGLIFAGKTLQIDSGNTAERTQNYAAANPSTKSKAKGKSSANNSSKANEDNAFVLRKGAWANKMSKKERDALLADWNKNIKAYIKKDKLKKEKRASNGMTYNEIEKRLLQFAGRNWGGTVRDKKTGQPRFPSCSEILEKLRWLASQPGPYQAQYQRDYEELDSLLKAKKELETKYPELKDKYSND